MEQGTLIQLLCIRTTEHSNVVTFDANYGRKGSIWLETHQCDSCGETHKCLIIDSSEGEYKEGAICKNCIDKMFA